MQRVKHNVCLCVCVLEFGPVQKKVGGAKNEAQVTLLHCLPTKKQAPVAKGEKEKDRERKSKACRAAAVVFFSDVMKVTGDLAN